MTKNNFVILAFSRTGSSSLANALRTHPDIKLSGEPFHPPTSQNNKIWYITQVKDFDTFVSTLDMIYEKNNGIKHCPKHVPFEYNKYILDSGNYKIIYLYRKNILKNVISGEIAKQTKEWGTRKEKILEHKFQPVSFREVSKRLHFRKNLFSEYRQYLISHAINYFDLSYEELYGKNVEVEKRMDIYFHILKFLGFHTDLTKEQVDRVRSILSPSTKVNSRETYRRIPNIDMIEKKLGSQENGYLFK